MTFTTNFYFICLFLLSAFVLDYKTVAGNMADTDDYSVESEDLTEVTWAHAVNSKAKLDENLKGQKMMLEADVVLGYLQGQSDQIKLPVMAHPPKTSSDISLEEFLNTVSKSDTGKGIKLDFKTKEAFAASENIIEDFLLKQDPGILLWLNADIIPGPVDCKVQPVDPDYFLSTSVTKFPRTTISVGWTTCYGNGIDTGSYTPTYIANMTDALNRNVVVQPVTFAVRAGLAAQSYQSLTNLIGSSTSGTTLTIWNHDDDYVNIADLRKLINDIGKDKIYLDLPDDMIEKLHSKANPSSSNIFPILFALLAVLHLM